MSKKIVIVESDTAFSKKLKDELAKNGFEVIETADGKGAYDLTKREKPDLVVLAVELAAGQSGYLVCGKIKKDDDLKKTPVIIIGKDPEGFEGHKKLKTRAEEYLKKPFAPEALTVKVGVLIGLPEQKAAEEEVIEDAISLDEPAAEAKPESDLEMLDDAFANLSTDNPPPPDAMDQTGVMSATPADIEPVDAAPEPLNLGGGEEDFALDKLGVEDLAPPPVAPEPNRAANRARPPSQSIKLDDAELQQLRAQVRELEEKISGLENQLGEKDAELAAAKASSGGGKDTSALKEQSLKKDKEILKLKQELNEKETELVELREKEAAFEEKGNAAAGEIAKRDAQVKALNQKVEQLLADKKKADAANTSAKDEARAAAANLANVQAELDAANDRLASLQGELDALKEKSDQLVREADQAKESARNEVDSVRGTLEGVQAELARIRGDHDSLKAEHDQRVQAHESEATSLRARIAELEDSNAKNEDRVVKAYQKIKGDEKLREKTRKAIAVAMQLLDDSAGANLVDEKDINA